jgi:hypothetical protein
MPKKSDRPTAGALDNSAEQFREHAAECLELAQTTDSPEKRRVYLKIAVAWHQMALRREKVSPGLL